MNARHRRTAGLALGVLAGLLGTAAARAQGTLATQDGLAMTVGASGAIESLKLNGVEQAAPSLSSGFAYRELPAAATDLSPNGSFESGSGGPGSWSWSNNSAGSWTWDASVAFEGSRSLRVDIAGSADKRSPTLTSASFPIAPNTPFNISCRMRTSSLDSRLDLYVVEKDATGHLVQRGVSSDSGTNDWETRSLTFTSSPTAVSASFKVEIFSGHGTAWIDDVRMMDVFAARAPVSFGGALAPDADSLVQTVTADGLTLSARFTPAETAIRVDATLTDTTGRDRAVELSFRLPLDIPGWSWEQNPVSSLAIADGVRYENLVANFGGQSHSVYPFAVVRNATSALTLATPMVPQMNRFSYDRQLGFRVAWDLGLSPAATKNPSTAAVTFWIYTQEPRWGFRSAAQKFMYLYPEGFVPGPGDANGAWAISQSALLESVPNFQDFGWQFVEGINEIDFVNESGLSTFHYVDASGYFRNFPGYTSQPSYDVLASALQSDATAGTGTNDDGVPRMEMAQATVNSSPRDDAGRLQVFANSYFWYGNRLQIYPASPDPDIPAPSMWSVVTEYRVDGRAAWAAEGGNHLDGIFLDDLSNNFAGVENYRRDLWALSDAPLTFSWETGKVTLLNGFSMAEFCASFRRYVHQRGISAMGSVTPGLYVWLGPHLDVLGGETVGADSVERSYVRRVLGSGRPWTNLFVPPDGAAPDGAQVLGYLRQALLLGYFPGFNGAYWRTPAAYERDRPAFRQYIPLIRAVTNAGWKPVTGVTPSNAAVTVERFDDERSGLFFVTAQIGGPSSATIQFNLDGALLGILDGSVTVQELVRNKNLPASRVGADVKFSDTLAPGETLVYRVSAPRDPLPDRGPTRRVAPRS